MTAPEPPPVANDRPEERFCHKCMIPLVFDDRVQVCDCEPDRGEKYRKPFPGGCRHDVYDVLVSFGVTCPAVQHAVKKLLCAGQRGGKSRLQDLQEAGTALARAAELETTGGT